MTDSNHAAHASEQAAEKVPEQAALALDAAVDAAPEAAADGLEAALEAALVGTAPDDPEVAEEPEYPVNPRYVDDGDNSRFPPALRPCPAGPTH